MKKTLIKVRERNVPLKMERGTRNKPTYIMDASYIKSV